MRILRASTPNRNYWRPLWIDRDRIVVQLRNPMTFAPTGIAVYNIRLNRLRIVSRQRFVDTTLSRSARRVYVLMENGSVWSYRSGASRLRRVTTPAALGGVAPQLITADGAHES